MGRTLAELDQVLTGRELAFWLAYDAQSPIGDIRRDMYDAQLAAAVVQSRGSRATSQDFLIKWGAAPHSPDADDALTDDGRPALTAAVLSGMGARRAARKGN